MKKSLPAFGALLIVILAGLGYYLFKSNSGLVAVNPSNNLAAASVPTNGLIGWWKLGEGSGTTANDSSGQGNTGTLENSPVWTTGQNGKALSFNGTNYVNIPDSASLQISSTDISVFAWVNPTSVSENYPTIVSKNNGSTFYQLDLDGSGHIRVCLTGNNSCSTGNVTVPANTWSNIGFTYDGANIRTYLNDVLDATIPYTNAIGSTQGTALTIGSASPGDCGGTSVCWTFQGSIDNAMVYNLALSPAQVTSVYQATSVATAPSAVTSWFEVTNSAGTAGANGIVGATITISGGNLSSNLVLTTGSTASISTTALTVGQTYTVTTSASGYASQTSTLTVTSNLPVQVIALSPSSSKTVTTLFEITNSAGAAGANGIVGATITLSGGNLKSALVLTTGSTAAVSTTALTVGQIYNATISAPGYTTLTTTAGINTAGEVVKWSLVPIPITVWFETINAATSKGIPNVTITISNASGQSTLKAPITLTTNANASVSDTPFPLGIYTVTATAPGYAPYSAPSDYISTAGQVVKIGMTPSTATAQVTLPGGGVAAGAQVVAIDNNTETLTSLTANSSGQISFPDIIGDPYTIIGDPPNYGGTLEITPTTQGQSIPLSLSVVPTPTLPAPASPQSSPVIVPKTPALVVMVPGANAGLSGASDPESYLTDLYNDLTNSGCATDVLFAYFKYNGITEHTDTSATNLNTWLATTYTNYVDLYGGAPPEVFFITYSNGDNVFRRATQLATNPNVESLFQGATVDEFNPVLGGVDQGTGYAYALGPMAWRFADLYYGFSYEENLFSQSSINTYNSLVGKQNIFEVVNDKYLDGIWNYANPTWLAQETATANQPVPVKGGASIAQQAFDAKETIKNLAAWTTTFKRAAAAATYNEYCFSQDQGDYGVLGPCNNTLPASDTTLAAAAGFPAPGHAILLFDDNFVENNIVGPICSPKIQFETLNANNTAAGVPNATVTISNAPGNTTLKTPIVIATNANAYGSYAPLPFGHYTITATAPGFQTLTQGPDALATANQTVKLDMVPASNPIYESDITNSGGLIFSGNDPHWQINGSNAFVVAGGNSGMESLGGYPPYSYLGLSSVSNGLVAPGAYTYSTQFSASSANASAEFQADSYGPYGRVTGISVNGVAQSISDDSNSGCSSEPDGYNCVVANLTGLVAGNNTLSVTVTVSKTPTSTEPPLFWDYVIDSTGVSYCSELGCSNGAPPPPPAPISCEELSGSAVTEYSSCTIPVGASTPNYCSAASTKNPGLPVCSTVESAPRGS